MSESPVRVCVVDDYDIVVAGTAALLAPHADLVRVVERTTEEGPDHRVDVALLDCFALPDHGALVIAALAAHPNVGRVAVYSWDTDKALIEAALRSGARGFLSKGLDGRRLAEAIVAVHRGQEVVARADGAARATPDGPRRWPGHAAGLTERESEVLALITQGKSTRDIASALYIGVNSVKTHTQKIFRKIGVSTRTEAALWGVDHGFRPDRSSHDEWAPARPNGPRPNG
ncbi:response regulator transcription factor [Iamia sp. SCSIO 61187]|uniref:LuxR C-terminal-related transcriptional regulator n=1 Tax=Iamia sp. SCSIO 61187 TaxID=2722752 RepID=UPI001C631FE5|nr:response regulator transcription factor [Iamia sp. SCSIO 61187]